MSKNAKIEKTIRKCTILSKKNAENVEYVKLPKEYRQNVKTKKEKWLKKREKCPKNMLKENEM